MAFSLLSIHLIIYFIFITIILHYGLEATLLDQCKCGSANFGIDVADGELKSPGYPIHYCNNLNCKYEIDAAPGQSIHLSIVFFETELRHDVLEIYQTFIFANNQHLSHINTLSGKDIGWPLFASSINSGFTLKFITDSAETFGGFHARFKRINATSSTNSCPTFFFEATSENRTLPSPPANFTILTGCTYMVNTSEGYGIKLILKSLAFKAKFTVYETENYEFRTDHIIAPLYENIGLMNGNSEEIVSRTNSVLIRITLAQQELFPVATDNKLLFEAQFSRTTSPCKCFPRSYTIPIDHSIILSSPGFPLQYCDGLHCETELQLHNYAINLTHHNAIKLEIHTFNLEHGSDFLHFLDKSKQSSKHLISRTGHLSTTRNKFFTFSGESAVLRMITDSTVTDNGFNMTISVIQKRYDCGCKGQAQPLEFSSLTGTFSFSSPVDCGFLDCFFQFNRPVNVLDTDRIRLIINITYNFKNGEEEFLEVLTNINSNNIVPSHLYERDVTILEPALAQSGTEEVTNDTPMMIWYHLASDINRQSAQFDIGYEWKSICKCGSLELEAKKGLWKKLTSPDYPSHYCNLMKCQYLITAPRGYIVTANITEIALEPNDDVLIIFDGSNITDRQIKSSSGLEVITDLLRSTAETMTVYFETDISIVNKGFVLYYTAEDISTNDGGDVADKLEGSKHLQIIFFSIFLVTCMIFGLACYRQLLNLVNRRSRWHDTSVIGFMNLSHEVGS